MGHIHLIVWPIIGIPRLSICIRNPFFMEMIHFLHMKFIIVCSGEYDKTIGEPSWEFHEWSLDRGRSENVLVRVNAIFSNFLNYAFFLETCTATFLSGTCILQFSNLVLFRAHSSLQIISIFCILFVLTVHMCSMTWFFTFLFERFPFL